ncbi:hypothetical protein [Novosphingobium sp. AAP93]|uniref:hypothetical protein n=1 Tax=Novosphingobium sp. AAP93 TaxID=1523427 RepID=UPI0006B91644|nr:hypothetical protein [Novosphingobium sp. AAP93]KPF79428.1 hypothetical protein IP83_16975 [Novosphingobium sp. AAP93]
MLAAFFAVAACTPQADPPAPVPVPAPVLAGGWRVADPAGEDVQAAARYAASQLPTGGGAVAEVVSADTQVVAGMNIRMVLRLTDGSRWRVVVWRRLDDTFALTESAKIP